MPNEKVKGPINTRRASLKARPTATYPSGEAVVVVGPVCEFDSQQMSKTFLPGIQNSGFWAHVVHGPPKDPKGLAQDPAVNVFNERTVPISLPLDMLKRFPVVYFSALEWRLAPIGRFCYRSGSFL